mmetsp:Transcript_44999/g.146166  ORF Transcript_44999/g.146166 Transcript_44999/m.146166 type:complete len:200 (-) Transcript_44999:405-1004(-)
MVHCVNGCRTLQREWPARTRRGTAWREAGGAQRRRHLLLRSELAPRVGHPQHERSRHRRSLFPHHLRNHRDRRVGAKDAAEDGAVLAPHAHLRRRHMPVDGRSDATPSPGGRGAGAGGVVHARRRVQRRCGRRHLGGGGGGGGGGGSGGGHAPHARVGAGVGSGRGPRRGGRQVERRRCPAASRVRCAARGIGHTSNLG